MQHDTCVGVDVWIYLDLFLWQQNLHVTRRRLSDPGPVLDLGEVSNALRVDDQLQSVAERISYHVHLMAVVQASHLARAHFARPVLARMVCNQNLPKLSFIPRLGDRSLTS